ALDYLETRPEIDPKRIATLGISMGSTMAWWVAALDERVKVTVDICCQTEFHTILRTNGLEGHGIYYYVPDLLNHFTTADINALIAPRPHLALAGIQDNLTPPEGLDIIDREMQAVYGELDASENWELLRYDDGHRETEDGRSAIMAFLKQHV
ncbi:MAG: dienelactone hydrolase family protein, partial [bacterium]|nr:dienelactone hydrolase family protein [bacterium]